MCPSTIAALLGLATGCPVGVPAHLLAPADPRLETRFRPQPSPLAGLKRYEPVEARRDWGATPGGAEPRHDGGMHTKPGGKGLSMPGMDMSGMR